MMNETLKERKDLAIRIVALVIADLNERIPMSIVPGLKIGIVKRRGWTNYDKNKITIPIWVLRKSIHYIRYYVCHEVAHLITAKHYKKNGHHGPDFKSVEKLFCASFDVRLVFPERHHGRAYPIAICGPDGFFERSG